ncbi:IS1595 family transposase [Dokdonella immobilis]|uniref:Transposase zinc-ribbon domain-containing protein n=1 Tax=Dokdonella immobilis TaxID=578942 RepID=A0A1I4ZIN5_9GAMM|nr:IS1595 family transposase [Dokdonella immobilis]SFN49780.1 Transposase zinc-ribbon domain-containing protein [Dokdonella immobilis]
MAKADILAPHFQDADKAREYLEALRWPNGPVCPHCGSLDAHYLLNGKAHRPGLLKCKDCRKQFTVTVNTVFAGSKIPLNKWLLAVHLMCASKKAISSHQIHRMLGITYKSAWFMTHRIREAMKPNGGGLLGSGGGTVEADETYWGTSKPKPKGARGYDHQMKIVSLVERGGEKRTVHVGSVNAASVREILKKHVCPTANLMTDEASVYTKVGREFASHGVVRHKVKEYARGPVTTNTVEASFSLLKRGLIGTFHHVGEQHLQRYVTEFDFRWNTRTSMGFTDVERYKTLLGQIGGRRLMYRDS